MRRGARRECLFRQFSQGVCASVTSIRFRFYRNMAVSSYTRWPLPTTHQTRGSHINHTVLAILAYMLLTKGIDQTSAEIIPSLSLALSFSDARAHPHTHTHTHTARAHTYTHLRLFCYCNNQKTGCGFISDAPNFRYVVLFSICVSCIYIYARMYMCTVDHG